VLAASDGRCVICGGRDGVEAHHLEPIADGGHRFGAGAALYGHCHDLLHVKLWSGLNSAAKTSVWLRNTRAMIGSSACVSSSRRRTT
jgi:hypothetical protein